MCIECRLRCLQLAQVRSHTGSRALYRSWKCAACGTVADVHAPIFPAAALPRVLPTCAVQYLYEQIMLPDRAAYLYSTVPLCANLQQLTVVHPLGS